ncbi:Rid family detoxifying hydrolase [Flavobacterium ardleyense]|uniref:Rid family detoxifying hydrolase n=1 Tax=Flavobacterium ardleyense TaxID=2038737 RepID=UPI00298CB416|nr:Rid family detoxifying hydrolase [Flavobacterium ardleyense]
MKKIIQTNDAPSPIGPYNQAVQVGNIVYTSGQVALNPATGNLEMESIETETEQVMQNLKAVLTAANTNFENVVKTTIFITDMANFSKINAVYGKYFDEATAPARETVQVAGLPRGVNIEISMMAIV